LRGAQLQLATRAAGALVEAKDRFVTLSHTQTHTHTHAHTHTCVPLLLLELRRCACAPVTWLCSPPSCRAQRGLSERDPNRPHSVNGSRSSGDSFFDKASSRNSSRGSARDRKSFEPDPAGSTGWKFRSGGFRAKPRYNTQKELLEARAKAMLPDPSFDVDGDGVVSATDYYLSSQFDVDKDGHIDDEERAELRKTMVDALVRKYRAVPKVEDEATAEMIKMFTRDLDKTVQKSTFMQDFNNLCVQRCCAAEPRPLLTTVCCGMIAATRKQPRHRHSIQRRCSAASALSRWQHMRREREAQRRRRIRRAGSQHA
jgi:hypothetical protein